MMEVHECITVLKLEFPMNHEYFLGLYICSKLFFVS